MTFTIIYLVVILLGLWAISANPDHLPSLALPSRISNMSLSSWLHNIEKVGEIVLPLVPGVPAPLIPFIIKGIQTAETIPGADGPTKLAAAVSEVKNGADAINAVKPGTVNTEAVNEAVVHGISTVIAITNVKGQ